MSYLSDHLLYKLPFQGLVRDLRQKRLYRWLAGAAAVVALYLLLYAELRFVPLDNTLYSAPFFGALAGVVLLFVILLVAADLVLDWCRTRNTRRVAAVICAFGRD